MRFVPAVVLGCVVACGAVEDKPPGDDGGAPMDFTITVDEARVRVVEGNFVDVGVTIARNMFADPVVVTVGGLPSGVTADPLTITGDSGTLTLRSAAGATQGDAALMVTGTAGAVTHDAALSLLAMGPSGTLDQSFGLQGTIIAPPSGRGQSMVLQPDGKIVVAGVRGADVMVARFLADGAADTSFAGTGVVILNPTTLTETLKAVVLQPDGKIVVAGSFTPGGAISHGLVMRFNADGSLDTGFGNNNGRAELDLNGAGSPQNTQLFALALQPGGGIVVAGLTDVGVAAQNLDGVVARLTPAGTLDPNFGTGGRTTTPILAGTDRFLAMTVQPDGKIVTAGAAANGTSSSIAAFARYTVDGQLDASFSGDGKLTLDLGDSNVNGSDFLFGVRIEIQSDGKILAAGNASANGGGDACLVRLATDGAPDATFGTNGVKVQSLGSGNVDFVRGFALQTDGKFVIGGGTIDGAQANVSVFLARFGTDTQLDVTFGSTGFVVKELGDNGGDRIDQLEAIALDADGRIVATGFFFPATGGDKTILARFWP